MYSLVKKKFYYARAGGWRLDSKTSWITRDISLLPDTSLYQVIKDFEDWGDVVKYFTLAFKRDTYTSDFQSKKFSLWAIVSNKLKNCEFLSFSQIQIVPSKKGFPPTTNHIAFELTEDKFRSLVCGTEILNPAFVPKTSFRTKIRQISDILFGKNEIPDVQLSNVSTVDQPVVNETSIMANDDDQSFASQSIVRGIAVFSPHTTSLSAITKPRLMVNIVEQEAAPEFSNTPTKETVTAHLSPSPTATPKELKSSPTLSSSVSPQNIVTPRINRKSTNTKKFRKFNFKKIGLFAASLLALVGLGYVGDLGLRNLESKSQKDPSSLPTSPTQLPIISSENPNTESVQLVDKSIISQVIVQEDSVCKSLSVFPISSNYSDQQWFRLDASKFFSCQAQTKLNKQDFKDSRLLQIIKFQDDWLNPSLQTEKLLLEAIPSTL
jgi:hypothetical protein